jgi:hypothetical protein
LMVVVGAVRGANVVVVVGTDATSGSSRSVVRSEAKDISEGLGGENGKAGKQVPEQVTAGYVAWCALYTGCMRS